MTGTESQDALRAIKVAVVLGTRPEAVKLAPVVVELRTRPGVDCRLVSTGQHQDIVRSALEPFGLEPDLDLDLGCFDQSLARLTGRLVTGLDRVLADLAPDITIVQGDTTTALVGALASFYRRIPVAHVEAGLRTGDLSLPFPEEGNRRIIDSLAARLFAPTDDSAENLRREAVDEGRIVVTGNTVVDALEMLRPKIAPPSRRRFPGRDLILVTVHRRESFGERLSGICRAVRRIADELGESSELLWPVHPNPNVVETVRRECAGAANVTLVESMGYLEFLGALSVARLALSDSGGVQEEAPSFGCPVLVLRDRTERPEGIRSGVLTLAGTDPDRIVELALAELRSASRSRSVDTANPFGDGRARFRIADAVEFLFRA